MTPKSKIGFLFIAFELLLFQSLLAQINAGKDITLCYGENTTLVASVDTAIKKYNPIYFTGEDFVHDSVFAIGFGFKFFGIVYDKFVISPNGWISFDTTLAGTRSCFRAKAIPNSNPLDSVPRNAILFPWQDWFPNVDDGSFTGYTLLGNGLFEKLVINFFNVRLMGDNNDRGTFQLILYETSNDIEVHITKKPSSGDYLSNIGTLGLHNSDGTKGIPAHDSLNGKSWIANNQGWKFQWTGNAANPYNVDTITFNPDIIGEMSEVFWYKDSYPGDCEGIGETLHIIDNQQTADYIAVVILNNALILSDTVRVTVNPPLLVDAGTDDTIVMGEKAILNGIPSGGSGSYQCKWIPSGYVEDPNSCNTETTSLDASHTFYLQVTDLAGCTARDSMTVFVSNGPLYAKLISPSVGCKGVDTCLKVNANGGEPPYEYIWWSEPEGFSDTTHNPTFCFTLDETRTFFVSIIDSEGTIFKDSALIFVPQINPVIYGDSMICEYQTAVYNSPALPGRSFQWSIIDLIPESDAAVVNEFTVNWGSGPDSGFIQVIETDTNYCSESFRFSIKIKPNPVPQISGDSVFCQGTTNVSYSSTDIPGHTYKWSLTPGSGTFSDSTGSQVVINWNIPGKETIILLETDTVFGCHTATTKEITINPIPNPLIIGPDRICEMDTSFYCTNYNEGSSYEWNLIDPSPGKIIEGSNTDSLGLFWDKSGTAFLEVTETIDSSGCNAASDTMITIHPKPKLSVLGEPYSVCQGDTVMIVLSGGDVYYWQTYQDMTWINDSSRLVYPKESVHHFITGIDTITECADTLSFDILVKLNPIIDLGEDRYIAPGETIILDPGEGYDEYQWNTGYSGQQLEVTTAGHYEVKVVLQGCTGQDSVRFTMPAGLLPIPNAFTPNGDGINDRFQLVGSLDQITTFTMQVFSRWGHLVFETTDPYEGWDGTFNGSPCPVGTYLWIIGLKENYSGSERTVTKQGYVSLLH